MKVTAADKGTGKLESITIKNEKGRLSDEEIERMVAEAEEFTAEDEAIHKKIEAMKIEAMNSLSNFAYGVKGQLTDQEGLGGQLKDDDEKTLLTAVKDTTDWVETEGPTASLEDIEEKLVGVQAIINPITSSFTVVEGAT
jgi:heat shock protein 5